MVNRYPLTPSKCLIWSPQCRSATPSRKVTCWRTILQDQLSAAGLLTDSIEFVGCMANNPQNCQGTSDWDLHHGGHSGHQAIDIANNYAEG
ncbi:hypothetical protein MKZ38_004969 [Zalerion maritima]|uniref:Uncharacterized protein n=1 Tax=Zalerion maritima TaxID=339359 RepID=A0AAD5RL30_9PEZI|nr:hypothetical protein MKZ38_004969 [Zalerion maritima]